MSTERGRFVDWHRGAGVCENKCRPPSSPVFTPRPRPHPASALLQPKCKALRVAIPSDEDSTRYPTLGLCSWGCDAKPRAPSPQSGTNCGHHERRVDPAPAFGPGLDACGFRKGERETGVHFTARRLLASRLGAPPTIRHRSDAHFSVIVAPPPSRHGTSRDGAQLVALAPPPPWLFQMGIYRGYGEVWAGVVAPDCCSPLSRTVAVRGPVSS